MQKLEDIKTKAGRTLFIKTKLKEDGRWAVRGLLRIYENQTADEQNMEATVEINGIGFTGADAEILSSFAKQVLRGRTLSPKQMAIVFKKMHKYAKQLLSIVDAAAARAARAVDLTEQMRDPNEEERRV